jgi:hypothetical protein
MRFLPEAWKRDFFLLATLPVNGDGKLVQHPPVFISLVDGAHAPRCSFVSFVV